MRKSTFLSWASERWPEENISASDLGGVAWTEWGDPSGDCLVNISYPMDAISKKDFFSIVRAYQSSEDRQIHGCGFSAYLKSESVTCSISLDMVDNGMGCRGTVEIDTSVCDKNLLRRMELAADLLDLTLPVCE